ncbi:MAG: nicotinate phosphoribosyltransferase [Candidatus Pacebacteria bacterium]|nr:nicotinate phosphoribosyltransferase [Candidatus Paceibacterota bacterium]
MTNQKKYAPAEGFLFTDQYQLTMAQLYFRLGLHEQHVQFDHIFRKYPDYDHAAAGYCINAGLESLVDWLRNTHITEHDIDCLRGHCGPGGDRMFQDDFLDWLRQEGHYRKISLRAIPEGRVVHPNVPLTVVHGPLAICQILETSLLNHLNYPILVATKASRVQHAGRNRPLLEFGIRRAQGFGGNVGARAALIGGADYTSNVGISHALGYPPKGTHAHSMVQLFLALGMTELDAFRAYAKAYPDNCILLVDTVDTLNSGVPNAIKVFEELRKEGHDPRGIRLDSGDLAFLTVQAAKMLDDAGFTDAAIVLSNELDEMVIWQILEQIDEEAPRVGIDPETIVNRLVYGVGTKLITSWGAPALSAAFKLVGVYKDSEWQPAIKVSESIEKTPNPGYKNAWRIYDDRGYATADVLSMGDEDPGDMDPLVLRHPSDESRTRTLNTSGISNMELLLVDVMQQGKLVYDWPSIEQIREVKNKDLGRLDTGVKRLVNPHVYHVSLTPRLWEMKQRLIRLTKEKEKK